MVARRQESHLAGRVGTLGGTTKEHHKPTHHLREQPEATREGPNVRPFQGRTTNKCTFCQC